MTLLAVALGWVAASVISGLFLGNLLHRFGGGAGTSGWDPVGTLDGAAVTSLESRLAPHQHRMR
jgi:hypothetical protein